jgi:hypothetical protein
VGIGKEQPHVREPLHGWGMNLLVVRIFGQELIGGTVSHTHVVSHKQDHIGPV